MLASVIIPAKFTLLSCPYLYYLLFVYAPILPYLFPQNFDFSSTGRFHETQDSRLVEMKRPLLLNVQHVYHPGI